MGAVRALIGPHAGFSYSGPTAGHAYRYIEPSKVKRIFLLGPSHKFYTRKCCLSQAVVYETPLGPARVDTTLIAEFAKTGAFEWLSPSEDEAEHSLELHMPFIMEAMKGRPFTLCPVIVGSLDTKAEAFYGLASGHLIDWLIAYGSIMRLAVLHSRHRGAWKRAMVGWVGARDDAGLVVRPYSRPGGEWSDERIGWEGGGEMTTRVGCSCALQKKAGCSPRTWWTRATSSSSAPTFATGEPASTSSGATGRPRGDISTLF